MLLMQRFSLEIYRPRLLYGLLEVDPGRRLQFCEVLLNEERQGDGISRNICWSDEANFKFQFLLIGITMSITEQRTPI
jgi:hypothetical protein